MDELKQATPGRGSGDATHGEVPERGRAANCPFVPTNPQNSWNTVSRPAKSIGAPHVLRSFTTRIPGGLKRDFRMTAAYRRISIQQAAAEAISAWLLANRRDDAEGSR